MKIIILILILSLIFISCTTDTTNQDISKYLPINNEVENWNPVDTVKTFVGEDLFLLINGGAEIYHKHGFIQVISQTFENSTNKQVSIEFYEMKTPEAAKTIYESKISENGDKLEFGTEATLNNYYLNMYYDKYLLTLIGYDSEDETVEGIRIITKAIANKLK
jgi:hypothetical protein